MKTRFLIILMAFAYISCKNEIKEITETYPNGNPKKIEYFKQKDSLKIKVKEEGFFFNKKIKYRGSFKDNQPSGKWKYWYQNGKVFSEKEIKNKLSSNWKIFNTDGKPFMDKTYNLTVIEEYPNGAPYHIYYSKKGDKYKYEYFFHPDFQLQMQGATINNIRDGKWAYWYENGNPWSVGYYKNGLNDSTRTVWYENGKIRYEGKYKDGIEVGIWKFYDETGSLVKEADYDNKKVIDK